MSRTIADLREHLFSTLDNLRDKTNPMDIDRAKAVAEVAQTIINSAKVEVEHLKATGNTGGSGFMALPDATGTGKLGTIHNPDKGTTTTVSLLEGARRTVHIAK